MSEPRIIKQLDPYEIEALIKAQKEAEATRETARLAAQPVKAVETMPGPEEIPKVIYEGKEVPYLSLFPAYPEHKYGPAEEPLVFEQGDPRAAIVGHPQILNLPKGDAELPPGYPGRLTWAPSGQYAVSSTGPIEVTRLS